MLKTDRLKIEAAWLRVLIAIPIVLYVAAYLTTVGRAVADSGSNALIAIAIWTLAGLGLLAANLIQCSVSPTRRIIGMVLDLGMVTFFLCSMGQSGVLIV